MAAIHLNDSERWNLSADFSEKAYIQDLHKTSAKSEFGMFRNIPSATLRKLVVLSERKEALMARVQEIEQAMLRIQRETESTLGREDKPAQVTVKQIGLRKTRRQTGRGELKKKIISALRAAGKRGTTVSDLSKKLNVKRANLYVWFNGTGRNIRAIKKVGPAKYRLG